MKLIITGGQQNTGNLGVSALGTSCVDQLRSQIPDAQYFLENTSAATVPLVFPEKIENCPSLKIYPEKSLRPRYGTRHLALAHRVSRSAPNWIRQPLLTYNRTLQELHLITAALDISAGDSFAEIYSESQFGFQCDIKEFFVSLRIPLIFMPQTIGPFKTEPGRERARRILNKCALVATRDLHGLSELEELLGRDLDSRFVECPDMAFGLRPVAVDLSAEKFVQENCGGPLIGLNVSELLYSNKDSFGLGGSNTELMRELLEWLLSMHETKILFVPHVFPYKTSTGQLSNSDLQVCKELFDQYSAKFPGRIGIVERQYSPGEIKFIIGKCSFFIGARMHACIAAISQGVPTATLAYSKKAAGVMGLAGVADSVVELRGTANDKVVSCVRALFERQDELRREALEKMSDVRKRIALFFSGCLKKALDR